MTISFSLLKAFRCESCCDPRCAAISIFCNASAIKPIGRRRDLGQIEPEILSAAQRVLQFHDAELFAGGPQNDSDFASANPTVYTNLWLQIKSVSSRRSGSGPRRRVTFVATSGVAFANARALILRHGCDSPPRSARIKVRKRREVVGNNFALARSN